jgi:hypothetical protein
MWVEVLLALMVEGYREVHEVVADASIPACRSRG